MKPQVLCSDIFYSKMQFRCPSYTEGTSNARGSASRSQAVEKVKECPAEVALQGLGRYTVVNRIRWQEADGNEPTTKAPWKVSGNPEPKAKRVSSSPTHFGWTWHLLKCERLDAIQVGSCGGHLHSRICDMAKPVTAGMLGVPSSKLSDALVLTEIVKTLADLNPRATKTILSPTRIIRLIHRPKYSLSPAINALLPFADFLISVDVLYVKPEPHHLVTC
jgi:hypothetical protein